MRPQLQSFITSIANVISSKVNPNTISPGNVGDDGFVALATIIDELLTSNEISITGGMANPSPSMGTNGDYYFQGSGSGIQIHKKIANTWQNVGVIDLGITFPDTNISVKTSLKEGVVTASGGIWFINNDVHQKNLQTQFNISTPGADEKRDLIYAGEDNEIHRVPGTSGAGVPPLPTNTVLIDVVVIPVSEEPYLINGVTQVDLGAGVTKVVLPGDETNISPGQDPGRLDVSFLPEECVWSCWYLFNGVKTYLNPDQLQGGYLYGFPTRDGTNEFTFKFTYIE